MDEGQTKQRQRSNQRENNEAERTLFVRNIGWDTDEAEFREFMESFGQLKYAVLCKTRGDLMDKVDGEEQKVA